MNTQEVTLFNCVSFFFWFVILVLCVNYQFSFFFNFECQWNTDEVRQERLGLTAVLLTRSPDTTLITVLLIAIMETRSTKMSLIKPTLIKPTQIRSHYLATCISTNVPTLLARGSTYQSEKNWCGWYRRSLMWDLDVKNTLVYASTRRRASPRISLCRISCRAPVSPTRPSIYCWLTICFVSCVFCYV